MEASLYNQGLLVGAIPSLYGRMHHERDKAAVIEGDRRLTWGELSDRTARVVALLAERGVGRGDKVSVVLQNRVEYPELVYGIAALGAAIVPISYRFVAAELEYAIRHSESKAVIVDQYVLDVFVEAHAELPSIGTDDVFVIGDAPAAGLPYRDYASALAAVTPAADRPIDVSEDDVFHVAFTGGTTGPPKACEAVHRSAFTVWTGIGIEIGIGRDDTMLISGPFYHGLGFAWGLQQLMVGGTIVLQRAFDPHEALRLIQDESVTVYPAAPTLFTMILAVAGADELDRSSMRVLVSAAAPLLTATKESLLAFFGGAELYEYYGSTEAGMFAVLRPADQRRKVRCVGQPWFGMAVAILGPDGESLPAGEIGAIYKRGPAYAPTYLKNPEATAEAFRGEWLTSGDVGYLDDEGYLYVVDRAKDMIISGGVNIFPTEIEEVLASHPDVLECAVVGLPDERWGERVTAFVVARPGSAPAPGALDELCLTRLARYKRPREYEFLPELPRNASGKLLKRQLRETAPTGGAR